jgi:hypothetical protein
VGRPGRPGAYGNYLALALSFSWVWALDEWTLWAGRGRWADSDSDRALLGAARRKV